MGGYYPVCIFHLITIVSCQKALNGAPSGQKIAVLIVNATCVDTVPVNINALILGLVVQICQPFFYGSY